MSAVIHTEVATVVRAELVRADLTERQFRVAEFFVSATLDRGRQFVKGVKLEELGTALGLTKGNVCEAVLELQTFGILQVWRAVDGVEHRILPDSVHWFVNWRYNPAKLEGYLQALDVASRCSQAQLLEPDPDLRAAMADTSMESAARFSLRVPRTSHNRKPNSEISSSSNSVPNFEGVRGVRVLEDGFSIKEDFERRSHFNDSQKAVNPIVEVPNSGTGLDTTTNGEQDVDGAGKALGGSWSDDRYIVDKLRRNHTKLFEEIWAGKTKLARDFSALYSIRPERARQLVSESTTARNPAAWLNVAVAEEFAFETKT
jgi:hypothetical protein